MDACVRHLRDLIVRGELAPGSFLPPERTLATQLGINRTTLRAAIHRLAEGGLLEAQQGRGTLVKDFRAHASVDVLAAADDGALVDASLDLPSLARDLLAVRRALARVVLEALVEQPPGAAAIATVVRAIDGLEAVARAGASTERLSAADLAVLTAVVEATGRPGLRLCMNPVARTLTSLPRLAAAIYVDPFDNVAGFRGMVPFLEAPGADLVEPLVAMLAARDAATLERLVGAAAHVPGSRGPGSRSLGSLSVGSPRPRARTAASSSSPPSSSTAGPSTGRSPSRSSSPPSSTRP